jgi:hypothetical protein
MASSTPVDLYAFRSVDLALCATFLLGMHFVWHLLNATVLHVLLRAAIARRRRA